MCVEPKRVGYARCSTDEQDDYRRWYPNFTHTTDQQKLAA
jgi:hypothetical protein